MDRSLTTQRWNRVGHARKKGNWLCTAATTLTLAFMVMFCDYGSGADCFKKADWPKIIGFQDGAESSVQAIDINQDGILALAYMTKSQTFAANPEPGSCAVMTLDTNKPEEAYDWIRVFNNVVWGTCGVHWTPIASHVLVDLSRPQPGGGRNFIFLKNGDQGGSVSEHVRLATTSDSFYSRDRLVMRKRTGAIRIFVALQTKDNSDQDYDYLIRMRFDTSENVDLQWKVQNKWKQSETSLDNSHISLILDPEEDYLLTQSSTKEYSCRLDIWDQGDLDHLSTKGKQVKQDVSLTLLLCRLPSFVKESDDKEQLVSVVEYFEDVSTGPYRRGILRQEFKADKVHEGVQNQNLKSFDSDKKFRFIAAKYWKNGGNYNAATTAVDQNDGQFYAVTLKSENNSVYVQLIQGYSQLAGTFEFYDAIVTNEPSSTDSLPKGFFCGKMRAMSSYVTDCDSKQQLYKPRIDLASPEGFVDQLNPDQASCRLENTDPQETLLLEEGGSIEFESFNTSEETTNDLTVIEVTDHSKIQDATNLVQNGVGQWESAFSSFFESCKVRDTTKDLSLPVFSDDDFVEWTIDESQSDSTQVPFTQEWAFLTEPTCAIDFNQLIYQTKVSGAVPNKFEVEVEVPGQSTGGENYVNIELAAGVDSSTIHDVDHIVEVTATLPDLTCSNKSFRLKTLSCKKDQFHDVFWMSSNVNTISDLEQIIGWEAISYSFSEVGHSLSYCLKQYYWLQEQSEEDEQFYEYTGKTVSIDTDTRTFTINATAYDFALANKTRTYRIVVASVPVLADAEHAQYWELTVTYRAACPYLTPVLTSQYPVIQISELGDPLTIEFPGATNEPVPETQCGPYTFQMIWPDLLSAQPVLSLGSNKELVAKSNRLGDRGTYSAQLMISLEDYPMAEKLIVDLMVNVDECYPMEILMPKMMNDIYFQIGSKPIVLPIQNFTHQPDCQGEIYEFLETADKQPIDPNLQVNITDDHSLLVNTTNSTFEGQQNLTIRIQSSFRETLRAQYNITLHLTMPEILFNNTAQIDMISAPTFATSDLEDSGTEFDKLLVPQKGLFEFQLPEPESKNNGVVRLKVDLGKASAYLKYDSEANSIKKIDQGADLLVDDYQVSITLSEQGIDGKTRTTSYKLSIQVLKTFVADFSDPSQSQKDEQQDYPVPKILPVSKYGELAIRWSKDMIIPMNETKYAQELRKNVTIFDLITQTHFTKTAFEVTFAPSYMHQTAIEFEYEYIGWADQRQLQLKLHFDKPNSISMEIPADQIHIKFWDESLFQAQDGNFVESQLLLTRTLFPQLEQEPQSEGLVSTSSILTTTVGGSLGMTFGLSFFMSMALSLVWSLLNTLQILTHLPLFSVQFPGWAFVPFKAIIEVATFDLFPVQIYLDSQFSMDPDAEAYNETFERIGYEARSFIQNAGMLFFMLASILVLIVLSSCLLLAHRLTGGLVWLTTKLNAAIYWNYPARILLEGALELTILCFLDFGDLQWSHSGKIVSTFVAGISATALISLVFFIRCGLRDTDLANQSIKQRFSSLYEGLKEKTSSLILTEWFICRRVIFAASTYCLYGHLWAQTQILFGSSIMTLYILKLKIYSDPYVENVETCNEIFVMIIQYHVLTFSDLVESADTKVLTGKSCAFLTILCIVINLAIILKSTCVSCKSAIKRSHAKARYLKEQKIQTAAQRFTENRNKIDVTQLRKQIIAVEVKAKKTAYLNAPPLDPIKEQFVEAVLKARPLIGQANQLEELASIDEPQQRDQELDQRKPTLDEKMEQIQAQRQNENADRLINASAKIQKQTTIVYSQKDLLKTAMPRDQMLALQEQKVYSQKELLLTAMPRDQMWALQEQKVYSQKDLLKTAMPRDQMLALHKQQQLQRINEQNDFFNNADHPSVPVHHQNLWAPQKATVAQYQMGQIDYGQSMQPQQMKVSHANYRLELVEPARPVNRGGKRQPWLNPDGTFRSQF